MYRYKLSTGLATVKENPTFATDSEAWEYLRKVMPGKFATLYKEIEVSVALNNEVEYIDIYNKKYAPSPVGQGPSWAETLEVGKPRKSSVWIPVLEGVTDHTYFV